MVYSCIELIGRIAMIQFHVYMMYSYKCLCFISIFVIKDCTENLNKTKLHFFFIESSVHRQILNGIVLVLIHKMNNLFC